MARKYCTGNYQALREKQIRLNPKSEKNAKRIRRWLFENQEEADQQNRWVQRRNGLVNKIMICQPYKFL